MRLDLREGAGGSLEAVVSCLGMPPSTVTVTDQPTQLLLEGNIPCYYQSPDMEKFFATSWAKLTVSKNAGGGSGVAVVAQGSASYSDGGDNGGSHPIEGAGVLANDSTSPTAKFELRYLPGRRAKALLPWDPVLLSLSEPVDEASLLALMSATEVTASNTAAVDPLWLPEISTWAGVQRIETRRVWQPGAKLSLVLPAGIGDPAGNVSSVDTKVSLSVLDVGAPASAFDLEEPPPGLWGISSFVAAGPEAPCEQGSCVDLGSGNHRCNTPPGGLALSLSPPPGATTLHVRYRVWLSEAWDAAKAAQVELHGAGAPVSSPLAPLTQDDFQPADGASGQLNSASAWRTFSTALPPLAADGTVGVVLYRGQATTANDCIFIFGYNQSRVLIERVWAE